MLPWLAGDRVAGRGLAFSRIDSATLSLSTAVNRANPRPRFPGLGMTAVPGQKRKAWGVRSKPEDDHGSRGATNAARNTQRVDSIATHPIRGAVA